MNSNQGGGEEPAARWRREEARKRQAELQAQNESQARTNAEAEAKSWEQRRAYREELVRRTHPAGYFPMTADGTPMFTRDAPGADQIAGLSVNDALSEEMPGPGRYRSHDAAANWDFIIKHDKTIMPVPKNGNWDSPGKEKETLNFAVNFLGSNTLYLEWGNPNVVGGHVKEIKKYLEEALANPEKPLVEFKANVAQYFHKNPNPEIKALQERLRREHQALHFASSKFAEQNRELGSQRDGLNKLADQIIDQHSQIAKIDNSSPASKAASIETLKRELDTAKDAVDQLKNVVTTQQRVINDNATQRGNEPQDRLDGFDKKRGVQAENREKLCNAADNVKNQLGIRLNALEEKINQLDAASPERAAAQTKLTEMRANLNGPNGVSPALNALRTNNQQLQVAPVPAPAPAPGPGHP